MKVQRAARERAFTLIELMIVVAIIGVLSAIAIPSFTRYLAKARTAEAPQHLNKIYTQARVYFLEGAQGGKSAVAIGQRTFPASIGPTPGPSCCQELGHRCVPEASHWTFPSWQALLFSMDDPHYFRYEFVSSGVGAAAEFTVKAYADLNCNGKYSTYSMAGMSLFSGAGGAGSGGEMAGTSAIYRKDALE